MLNIRSSSTSLTLIIEITLKIRIQSVQKCFFVKERNKTVRLAFTSFSLCLLTLCCTPPPSCHSPHFRSLISAISLLHLSGLWSVMSPSFILTNALSACIVHRVVYSREWITLPFTHTHAHPQSTYALHIFLDTHFSHTNTDGNNFSTANKTSYISFVD